MDSRSTRREDFTDGTRCHRGPLAGRHRHVNDSTEQGRLAQPIRPQGRCTWKQKP